MFKTVFIASIASVSAMFSPVTSSSINDNIIPHPVIHSAQDVIDRDSSPYHNSNSAHVSQGDKIQSKSASCTAGRISKDRKFLITSGHCFNLSEIVYKNGVEIGKVVAIPRKTRTSKTNDSNDWSVLRLGENITSDGNIYSGDKIVDANTVKTGDKICKHGASTGKVICGHATYDENSGKGIVVSNGQVVKPGDSGGASWIPNKGLIGINYGVLKYSDGSEFSITTPIYGNVPGNYF